MKLTETEIVGAYIVKPAFRTGDHRGSFTRLFDPVAWEALGMPPMRSELNTSMTAKAGTIRGLHYQIEPYEQAKLMMCVRGAIQNVIVDMRAGSPTQGKWIGVELSDENRDMLFVPPGCANGFQSLEDETIIVYPLSAPYNGAAEKGVRFDDPGIGIRWPLPVTEMSDKDKAWPDVAR